MSKDAKAQQWLVQDNGKRTYVPPNAVDPELRLREMTDAGIDVIVELQDKERILGANAASLLKLDQQLHR